MADETTQYIIGDATADALGERRKRRFFGGRKKKPKHEPTNCENCGAALSGEYCSVCGQHAIDYRRSLWAVAVDAADSLLNWDTKFLKSLGVLLTRPGKLTNDFNSGRRVRYVHPLRLYLLASIAFFLIAKLVNFGAGNEIPFQLDPEDRAQVREALSKLAAPDSPLTPEQRARVDAARALWADEPALPADEKQRAKLDRAMLRLQGLAHKKQFKPKDLEKLNSTLKRIDEATGAAPPPPPPVSDGSTADSADAVVPPEPPAGIPSPPAVRTRKGPAIQFDPGDPKKAKDPMEQWLEGKIKEKIGEDGTKGELFLDTLRSHIPTMMLACVPLFAFVLKLLYIRHRRYYVEHLVYALHIHTFAYIAVVVITLISMGVGRWSTTLQALLTVALSFAAVGQVFLSIRRVYGQSWFMSLFKFLLGGSIYFTVIVLALVATALITLMLP